MTDTAMVARKPEQEPPAGRGSFPRPVVQGSLHDRDMHAGQHHVPLANTLVPRTSP
jgi:hypothetical protein